MSKLLLGPGQGCACGAVTFPGWDQLGECTAPWQNVVLARECAASALINQLPKGSAQASH